MDVSPSSAPRDAVHLLVPPRIDWVGLRHQKVGERRRQLAGRREQRRLALVTRRLAPGRAAGEGYLTLTLALALALAPPLTHTLTHTLNLALT